MGKYVLKRLLWMIPIVLGVTILVFTLMTFCPGNPAEIILGSTATEADMAAKKQELGLNDPFIVRLGDYMSDVFIHRDLGNSWITGVAIVPAIMERLPRTLALTLVTLLIAFGLGIPLGVLAATHQNRWQDSLCMTLALIGVAIPNFWLALMLVLVFAVNLGWLPAMGIDAGLVSYILPAISGCMTCLSKITSTATSYTTKDMQTDASGKIYIYLPENTTTTAVTTTAATYGGSVTTNNAHTAEATFSDKVNIALYSSTDGGTPSVAELQGGGEYAYGANVTITAPAQDGYKFLGWYTATMNGSTCEGYEGEVISPNLSYNFTAAGDQNLVAVYQANGKVRLDVTGDNVTITVDGKTETATEFKAGTKITLNTTGVGFIHWKNALGKIFSTQREYTFTLVSNTTLTAVYGTTADNSALVEYVSDNNQVLSAQIYTAGATITEPTWPAKVGHTFKEWSMTEAQIKAEITSGKNHIKVTPIYDKDTTQYTVTVNYVGVNKIAETQPKNVGETLTLTAPTVEGSTFSHWSSDATGTTVLGTSNTYFMVVTKDTTIYAIYDAVPIEKKPTVAITDIFGKTVSEVNRVTFVATRSVPDGYILMEQGVMYDKTGSYTNDTFVVSDTNIKRYVGSSMTSSGVLSLNVAVDNNDTILYARAYVVVKNTLTGNEETYYSEISQSSYNDTQKGNS